ncbi:unnamed protein product [Acanthocheilonema viteae]|uniref:Uncharacterized protein n=1 Tax=Acanthocheilonema viteae TaxID=6277 RepID=A0A498SAB8_ACAVI|nr:unnamed protein product [Acanthocheilonema viteae]
MHNLKSLYRSSTKDALSSERLNEEAHTVFSKEFVLTSDNSQNFVPEYVREKFQERIEPNLCTIKAVCKAEQKKPFYTFVLNWYKDLAHVDTDSSAPTSKSKKSPVRGSIGCCNDLAPVCPDPILRHKHFQKIINKHKMDEMIAKGHGNSDYNVKRLQQAMDQNPEALVDSLEVALHHLEGYHLCLKESSATQTSSMNKSSRAKRSLKELICIKVLVLEKGPIETICRRHSITEISSTESLRSTLQWIVGYRQSLHKSRIFFNHGGNIEDPKLQEIDLKEYGDKKMNNFPATNGMLSFVIDYANVIRGNSLSPYVFASFREKNRPQEVCSSFSIFSK